MIHDTLKEAEQQNEVSFTSENPGERRGTMLHANNHQARSPHLTNESKTQIPSIESDDAFRTPGVLELLLSRCAKNTWHPDPRRTLLFDRHSDLQGTEEFRTLRSRLCLAQQRKPLKKLLITSPLPKEGKSFVASNLARVIVQQPKTRVLLIDCDLRSAQLHHYLGAPLSPGLSDYLCGEADVFSVVQQEQSSKLFFIAAGKPITNPNELICGGSLRLLLSRLAPAFDWIVVDSPPAIPISDAKVLADSCDGVLIVIRAGKTPFDLAQKVCREFREKQFVGAVLNGAETSAVYSSYYSYKASRRREESDRK